MKKISIFYVIFLLMVFFSSCGYNAAFISNHNQNATQVQLSGSNFKVVDKVSGSSEVSYIFGIGGMDKRQLFENAYSDMMKKANLMNSSKAIINVMTEEHVSGFAPFYVKRTVTVSAHVVEFTN
jgi:hypothetical protein